MLMFSPTASCLLSWAGDAWQRQAAGSGQHRVCLSVRKLRMHSSEEKNHNIIRARIGQAPVYTGKYVAANSSHAVPTASVADAEWK